VVSSEQNGANEKINASSLRDLNFDETNKSIYDEDFSSPGNDEGGCHLSLRLEGSPSLRNARHSTAAQLLDPSPPKSSFKTNNLDFPLLPVTHDDVFIRRSTKKIENEKKGNDDEAKNKKEKKGIEVSLPCPDTMDFPGEELSKHSPHESFLTRKEESPGGRDAFTAREEGRNGTEGGVTVDNSPHARSSSSSYSPRPRLSSSLASSLGPFPEGIFNVITKETTTVGVKEKKSYFSLVETPSPSGTPTSNLSAALVNKTNLSAAHDEQADKDRLVIDESPRHPAHTLSSSQSDENVIKFYDDKWARISRNTPSGGPGPLSSPREHDSPGHESQIYDTFGAAPLEHTQERNIRSSTSSSPHTKTDTLLTRLAIGGTPRGSSASATPRVHTQLTPKTPNSSRGIKTLGTPSSMTGSEDSGGFRVWKTNEVDVRRRSNLWAEDSSKNTKSNIYLDVNTRKSDVRVVQTPQEDTVTRGGSENTYTKNPHNIHDGDKNTIASRDAASSSSPERDKKMRDPTSSGFLISPPARGDNEECPSHNDKRGHFAAHDDIIKGKGTNLLLPTTTTRGGGWDKGNKGNMWGKPHDGGPYSGASPS